MKTASTRGAYVRRLYLITFVELTATITVALIAGAAAGAFLGYFPSLIAGTALVDTLATGAPTHAEHPISAWLPILGGIVGIFGGGVVMSVVARFAGPLIGHYVDARFALLPPPSSHPKGELG